MPGTDLYRDLTWLPPAPADFRRTLAALDPASPSLGGDLRALATHALDLDDLSRVARALGRARDAGAALEPLIPLTLGLIGDGTLDLLAPALVGTAARAGFALTVVKGEYGQALQDALSPVSAVNSAPVDVMLLALDWRSLPMTVTPGDGRAADDGVRAALDYIEALRQGVRRNNGAQCIVPTLAPPCEALTGSLDRALPWTALGMIDRINQGIVERAAEGGDLLLDVASLAQTVGLAAWHDPSQWNMAKLPFAEGFIPLYADHVLRLIGAARGRSRRVLVLDLDNTLWGGVIGDDGMAGIRLAQGDAAGEAHLAVQRLALQLRARGVVLAVCSKNTDGVAREVFRAHPEMLLREEHIAAFRINWDDKASNIRSIAAELSLGLESIVFLDDNPVERDLVRTLLPQVAVVEVGPDPADYARTVAASGYFELSAFSDEDRARAEFYQSNAQRSTLKAEAGDLDAYMASLRMEIAFAPFDAVGRTRIAQLIAKSNQFNLTTRRYSEAQVREVELDPACITLQVRLTDSFGDNGMISTVICRDRGQGQYEIDTWLMSCRVLGRGVERMVLRELLDLVRARGGRTLLGVYRPTARNALVKDHYAELGFTEAPRGPGEETHWRIDVEAQIKPAPMTVRQAGVLYAATA
jgi:FkbH-like protein